MTSESLNNANGKYMESTKAGSKSPSFDSEDVLVESELELDGKKVQAYITKTHICWCATYASTKVQKQKYSTHMVNISHIFAVRYERNNKRKQSTNEIELFPSQYFSVHTAKKIKHHKWKYQTMRFHVSESEICQTWVNTLKNALNDFDRPRNLLVFVNPVGGKKQAEKIYKEKVAPLFEIAKISQNIIITERRNHAKDFLLSEDLSSYDGVISVGGDGMVSEVINGLIRYQDNTHEVIKSQQGKPIVLGIIPAGSTDTLTYCTSGCNCPITAALHIILGDQLSLDVCSVWQNNDFLKYSVSLMGYGYFGDLMKESETLRWMGPKRYDFAGFKKFMGNRSYEGEISFIEAPELNDDDIDDNKGKCTSGCKRCSIFLDEADTSYLQGEVEDAWKTVSGRFISVIGANISCRCARSSTGLSPHAHIGDGYIDLILIRKTSRARYLHHLIKVSEKTSNHFDFNFIDQHRVKEFKFKPIISHDGNSNNQSSTSSSQDDRNSTETTNLSSTTFPNSLTETSVWNVDGELVESPELHIKVHRQLITLFARGIED